MADKTTGEVLIIGGGISGITAAVEIAEFGHKVTLVEKEASLGGRVARMNQYFPKLCPPYCGLEIYYKRIRSNPNINYLTLTEVEKIEGSSGDFTVSLKTHPRFVNGKCTACNECVEACPVERQNSFNYGMDKTKAIYLPHEMAFPFKYLIDASVCPGKECAKCVQACKYDAIDLSMEATTQSLKVAAIIVATGWQPYEANKLTNLNVAQSPDIITNVMMERLASANGPTKGQIVRPSDGKKVEKIAFVQCAGSRDENHLPYCSAVCCLASLKQTGYVREANPDAQIYLFYIDLRASGRYEDFLQKKEADDKLHLIKGKVAEIRKHSENGELTVVAEDILSGVKSEQTVDMVVLATGIQPSPIDAQLPFAAGKDKNGFFMNNYSNGNGIYFAGCCTSPEDVSASIKEANGAALKAMQCIR